MANVALVGLGAFGKFCLEAFALMPDVKLVAVCDVDIARCQWAVEQYGLTAYDSIDALLHDERRLCVDEVRERLAVPNRRTGSKQLFEQLHRGLSCPMDQTSSPAYPAFAKPALSSKAASLLADAAYFLFPQSIIELEPPLMLAFVDSKPAQDRLKPRQGGPH